MSLLWVTEEARLRPARHLFKIGEQLVKAAASYVTSYSLSGMLYASRSGYLMLNVPNSLVRGVHAAMTEPGVELPAGPNGEIFGAHITVMRPEELAQIGGISKITERGKQYRYRLGGLVSVEPEQSPFSKAWMLRVHSPELQALRRSYGLSSLPNNGEYDFHVTVAVRRKGVLGRNDKRKATEGH